MSDKDEAAEQAAEALAKSLADPNVTVTDGIATVKLNRPIVVGDREIAHVTLKAEASLGDLIESDRVSGDMAKGRAMIVALTDLSVVDASKLRTDDMTTLMPLVGELAGKGHLTGGTS